MKYFKRMNQILRAMYAIVFFGLVVNTIFVSYANSEEPKLVKNMNLFISMMKTGRKL